MFSESLTLFTTIKYNKETPFLFLLQRKLYTGFYLFLAHLRVRLRYWRFCFLVYHIHVSGFSDSVIYDLCQMKFCIAVLFIIKLLLQCRNCSNCCNYLQVLLIISSILSLLELFVKRSAVSE